MIRRDRIDVLVDVWGHNAGNRLRMFTFRPAPVQAGWINFMHTTGLASMDYVLHADSLEVPGTEAFFTESIWRTGAVMAPYRTLGARLGPTPTPALAAGVVTFASFNHPYKLSEPCIAAWARILCARPRDRLILKYGCFTDPVLQRVTRARFAAHGADGAQIQFEGRSEGADYVRAFARVDLALDPSPIPGGTTTMNFIANGVPVLALKGEDFYARTCVPLLEPCGLGALAVDSWDAYVETALALAGDLDRLSALRAAVGPGFDASPYRDEVGFTRRLERDFRLMFDRWCEGRGL
jgi:predicted O-linked N-acetylglucosamine transferase (SPINDLY family)